VTAATRNVCGAPAVRLPTVNAVAVVPVLATTVVHDVPPLVLRSMRYPMRFAPPVLLGAFHASVTSLVPLVACRLRGALGAVKGIDAAVVLGPLLPARLVANTRNTYAVPLVRPVMTEVRLVAATVRSVTNVAPPSTDFSITYAVIARPPSDTGALQASVTWVSPAVAVRPVGILGTPNGVALTTDETVPAPAEISAVTRNRYSVPLVRPVTVYDVSDEAVFAATTVHVEPVAGARSTR
jgi:hypothetical protein